MIPVSCRWERREIDETTAKQLAQELDIPLHFARLLAGRGICTAKEAVRFLESPVSEMYDPFLMKGMSAAVTRILRALEDHEKITIYGDYDVDGMTAVSILPWFGRFRIVPLLFQIKKSDRPSDRFAVYLFLKEQYQRQK